MTSHQTKPNENTWKAAANQPFSKKCASLFSSNSNFVIQPKLTINQPNDAYEEEADKVADEVMRMTTPSVQTKPFQVSSLQRMCAECEEEEMQRKELNSEPPAANDNLESYVGNLESGGETLSEDIRNFFEPRFGYDFGNVKVHTDSLAAKSAQSINALAYTSGNNIIFNEGQYSAETEKGKRLLAHELTHVIQQTSGIQLSSMIARTTRESKSFADADGSATTVVRITEPGHCALVPKTQTRTTGDVGGKNAFVQFDFCRGGYGGSARGQINYGDAIDKASKAAQDFFTNIGRGQDFQRSSKTLEQDIKKIAPDAEITLSFQSKDLRVNIGGTGEASIKGDASGKATVKVEGDIGPVTVGVEGEISGGSQEGTQGQVLVTVRPADKSPEPADCRVCNCSDPKVDYSCTKKPPAGGGTPEPEGLQPITIPLFFEYSKTDPRKGWEGEYQSMLFKAVDLINNGYTIEKIEGNTSPEGSRKQKEGFEGNIKLADDRAAEVWKDLQAAISAKMSILRDPSLLRATLNSKPDVLGTAELLGSNDQGEVKENDLYKHIKQSVSTSQQEGKDIFTEMHVLGKDLPEEITKENQQLIDEFNLGKRGKQKLLQSEQLESLYKTLRRALVVLKPPKAAVDLKIKPEQAEKVIGADVDCTEENIKFLTDAIPVSSKLFDGECNAPGKETKQFLK